MAEVLAFAVVLLVAVLLSELANRTVLSTAVVFLAAGFALGDGGLGVIHVNGTQLVRDLAELALFTILFSDGMRVGVRDFRSRWRLPTQALALGLPLTLGLTALLARFIVGVSWTSSLLLGAALAPTDPVFASAIVAKPAIPARLRQMLNVESGLNDGLALPVVIVLLELATKGRTDPLLLAGQVALGIGLGVVIPLAAIGLQRLRGLSAFGSYEPLYAFSIGLLLFALSERLGANPFLAAFTGGATIASVSTQVRDTFHGFGETLAELLKLAALFAFGAVLSPALLVEIGVAGWLFAAASIVVARPAALLLALLRSPLPAGERITAAWFGPKGFASVVYGLVIADAFFAERAEVVHLIAAAVILSIVTHSSTDVLIARRFQRAAENADG